MEYIIIIINTNTSVDDDTTCTKRFPHTGLSQNKRDLLLHKIIIGKHILQTVRDEWACSSKYVLDEVSPALYDDCGLLRDH